MGKQKRIEVMNNLICLVKPKQWFVETVKLAELQKYSSFKSKIMHNKGIG